MFTPTYELFLSDCFLFRASLDGFCPDDRLFAVLCGIYGIRKAEEKKELRALIDTGALNEIASETDFKRYLRIKEYNRLTGENPLYSPEIDALISIKGQALALTAKSGLFSNRGRSKAGAVGTLLTRAHEGNRVALKLLGILQCEGLAVEKDEAAGTENLFRAARWGDYTAAMALLRYPKEADRVEVMRLLKGAVKNTIYEYLPAEATTLYGISEKVDCSGEILLLRRAFGMGSVQPDTYQSGYNRLLFGRTVAFREKVRIVLSRDQGILSEACELPLRLVSGAPTVDAAAFEALPVKRPEESGRVLQGLSELSLLEKGSIPPMCLSSKSDYVLECYADAIGSALGSANLVRIDLSDLSEQDLTPTKDHAFLRGLRDNAVNVCLLVFKGEIGYEIFEAAKAFLSAERRSKFHLKQPVLDLNLSSVLPICICDSDNAKRLKEEVELVELSLLSKEEKPDAIRTIARASGERYGVAEVRLEDALTERLCNISAEAVDRVLDCLVRENRHVEGALVLSPELADPCIRKIVAGGHNIIGFGGNGYENE